ncbi:Uncharacterised protein [Mycobacteroides abscessus subsp. massiliense]|nr:Uncharacterised protein [Mycobacteroides abscessus subsp. massiliense]SKQ33402.1 Uncharacterised protein [Mycobacteroides abscessus subsp. massiliense]SKV76573.1 Uncharacterised protein [Mycobacteroides abscessus subsp. massiliense]SKW83244.1 Uncharacterised protein [Mycobacteroides abscessus subsp. massiliense]
MFARILGPYLLIAALTVVGRPAHMRTLLSAFTDTNASVWTWVLGAFVLPMGLASIHRCIGWSQGVGMRKVPFELGRLVFSTH